jgi:hypothetical protein
MTKMGSFRLFTRASGLKSLENTGITEKEINGSVR